MWRIKICGITNEDDASAAADAGADAIGLNFFSKSRRFIELDAARQIAVAVPAGVMKIGVFVNHDADQIARIVDDVGLDGVQLHGDEPPSLLGALPKHLRIVRAYRCGREGLAPLVEYLDACQKLGGRADAVLIDADTITEYGGTGQRADWTSIAKDRKLLDGVPLLLAGGLTAVNVAAAIKAVRPDGVDVASGVESEPGRKDAAKVRDFIKMAREGFSCA